MRHSRARGLIVKPIRKAKLKLKHKLQLILLSRERGRKHQGIMSKYRATSWNLRHQRQEQVEGEEGNRYSRVHQLHDNNPGHVVVPMSDYEVAELTWENGQLAMHGIGGILPTVSTKPRCSRTGDTLESIVHHATCQKQELNSEQHEKNPDKISSNFVSSNGRWSDSSAKIQTNSGITKKRTRPESEEFGRNSSSSIQEEYADRGACASAGAAFCRDDDTTMMTWASLDSSRSLRAKTMDEDSASHGGQQGCQDKEDGTREETLHSHRSRQNHAAAIHNQSERRRRERINQKMKTLQKMVPNASKTDKASMLDEVIAYLKQLQAQVQMMSLRNMPQVMMPMGMQQNLQMSILARMGMGVGLGTGNGMLDLYSMARACPQSLPSLVQPTTVPSASPTFIPPPFLMPHLTLQHSPSQVNHESTNNNSSVPFNDPYTAFLAQQSMNVELYNKMATLYHQQVNQATQASNRPSQSNHGQSE